MENEKTREELEMENKALCVEVDRLIRVRNLISDENLRIVRELDEERQRGAKPSVKQQLLLSLALSAHGAFPHFFSVRGKWNKAEAMYAEGVRRGHLPKQ